MATRVAGRRSLAGVQGTSAYVRRCEVMRIRNFVSIRFGITQVMTYMRKIRYDSERHVTGIASKGM